MMPVLAARVVQRTYCSLDGFLRFRRGQDLSTIHLPPHSEHVTVATNQKPLYCATQESPPRA